MAKKKEYVTRASQVVSHLSTGLAQTSLTSQCGKGCGRLCRYERTRKSDFACHRNSNFHYMKVACLCSGQRQRKRIIISSDFVLRQSRTEVFVWQSHMYNSSCGTATTKNANINTSFFLASLISLLKIYVR